VDRLLNVFFNQFFGALRNPFEVSLGVCDFPSVMSVGAYYSVVLFLPRPQIPEQAKPKGIIFVRQLKIHLEHEFIIEHLILKNDIDIRIEKSIQSIIHKAREWERVEHPPEFITSSKD
jgi:hypothetical protein